MSTPNDFYFAPAWTTEAIAHLESVIKLIEQNLAPVFVPILRSPLNDMKQSILEAAHQTEKGK